MGSFLVAALFAVAGCATKKDIDTSDARKELEDRYTRKVGVAKKSDFTQEFGTANWCRPDTSGEETCRYYKKLGTKWMGDPNNRTHYDQFDEIEAEFGTDGTLKTFKANAQR